MFTFADSFDFYATTADAVAGYWDSGIPANFALAAGRFAGSQAYRTNGPGAVLVKSSGANDAIHHFVCAFQQSATLTGSGLHMYLGLGDSATAQCSVVFRSDGAMVLTSGGPAGTTLATYSGAVSTQSTWFAFEIEVVISATVGRFRVRKNGSTTDDFDSGGALNTRGGTANNYANRLTLGVNTTGLNFQLIDDLLWRSDAASVPFVGDIRCYTRRPTSDASTQFARSPSPAVVSQTSGASSTASRAANSGGMSAFTATYTGTIATASVSISTGGTGNMKAAIYDATRTTVLATSNAVVNPVGGANLVTFITPLAVTKGTIYYLATDQDFTIIYTVTGLAEYTFTTTYASFPAANPAVIGGQQGPVFTINITPTINSEFVNEAQQDGTTTYVYDATVGHADLYNIAAASSALTNVVAVTTRGFIEKSDAGARSGAVQLRSGANLIVPTTWNPADKTAGTTLSNANKTAALGAQSGVRGVFGQNLGKYYFEITATTWGSSAAVGLGNPSADLNFVSISSGTNIVGLYDSGPVYSNGANLNSINFGSRSAGDVVCIAVDLSAQLIWFRIGAGGNWNNNAGFSPGGTGGAAFAVGGAGGTLLYPIVSSYGGGANFTANFGASAFAGAVPAGFTSGFGAQSGGTTAQSTSTPLASSFTWLYRTDSTDPNTGSAWTPAAVDGLQIGPVVTA